MKILLNSFDVGYTKVCNHPQSQPQSSIATQKLQKKHVTNSGVYCTFDVDTETAVEFDI